MLRNYTLLKIFLFSTLLITEVYASGDKRNGTAGAQELLIPIGARGLALNGAYTAGLEGLEAVYFNPAGLSTNQFQTEAMFSHLTYIADIGMSYAAISTGFEGFGALALSVRSLDLGDIPVTTEENPYGTGATFSPTFVIVGLTYANQLTDRIKVGVNVNLINEQIMRSSALGVSFDIGVQYTGIAEIEGLKMGVVLKNFGPKMSFDGPDLLRTAEDDGSSRGNQLYKIDAATYELPSQLELGLAYERRVTDESRFIFATAFQNNNFANDEYKLAGEFIFKETLALRGGYSLVSEAFDTDEEAVFGPTFGLGLNIDTGVKITFDYAYRYAQYFDANHVFSVKLTF